MLNSPGFPLLRGKAGLVALAFVAPIFFCAIGLRAACAGGSEEAAAIEQRLAATDRFLASDECEGRGLGTKGIDLAADYIADQLRQLNRYGVKTDLWNGGPFQKFKVGVDAELGPKNHLFLVGPPKGKDGTPRKIELVLGKDYTPLAISGNGKFDLPLVFAGYGITARKANYDDFADVDVTGKAAVILRHQPRDELNDKESAPIKETAYTAFRHKASNACEHDAAAVVFCCDQAEIRRRHVKDDTLLSFHIAGTTFTHPDLPVITCRRAVIDNILHDLNEPQLGEIEDQIDHTLKPASRELKGWRIEGETEVRHVPCEVKNIAAVLPGEGPLADEAIVLGAHYDHLGYGSWSTLPSKPGPIYHGADDNASGDAVVLEVARTLAQRSQKLRRTVIFLFFTGEEWGFWGSSYYVNDPLVPMSKTAAMINLDMVGRLREDALTVNSVGTGTGFAGLLDQVNRLVWIPSHEGRGRIGPQRPGLVLCEAGAEHPLLHGQASRVSPPHRHFSLGERFRHAADYRLRAGRDDGPGQRPAAAGLRGRAHAAAVRRHVAALPGLRARFHPRGAGLSDQRGDLRQSGRSLRSAGRRRDREVRQASHRHLRRF